MDASPEAPDPPHATDRPTRHRALWAQSLRRVLHVDALSRPKCSRVRAVPMVVLAFLTDIDPYASPLQTEIKVEPVDEGCDVDPPEEESDRSAERLAPIRPPP